MDLDVLSIYEIIPSLEMFHEYHGLIINKGQVIKGLVTNVQEALKNCNSIEIDMVDNLDQLGCKMFTSDNNLIPKETIILDFTNKINA